MKNIKNFRIFEGEEVKNKTIYVLIGPPSVGKSTWIKTKFGEIQPFVINRDDIVEKVAEEYGWTYDDLFSLPIKDVEKEGDKNEKYGTVIKSPAYMTWAPLSYDKVLEANGKIQDIFNKRIAEGKGKENIVVDMTNMNSGSRKGALKVIEGVEGEYHKVAVVFNFKGAEEIIKKMAAKRSEEMKAKGKSKTIPPAAFDRMFTSYDLQDDKGIPFDEGKIKDVLSKEGFDEVVSVDNTAELKRVIDESEKAVAENKNNMKYIKTFENFNSLDPNLVKSLKTIVTSFKTEMLGSTVHLSEEFGEGYELKDLAEYCGDEKIASILNRVAKISLEECEGSAVNILEIVDEEDCDYIAQFLGLQPLNYEELWTQEEEKTWYSDYGHYFDK
jgi:hypothetical protein